MNEQVYYNPGESYAMAPASGTAVTVPSVDSIAAGVMQNTRQGRQLAHRVERTTNVMTAVAQTAQTGIVLTTALSAVADQAAMTVPSAEPYARQIVGAFTNNVVKRIESVNWR